MNDLPGLKMTQKSHTIERSRSESVSLCMIVKNEEAVLAGCLDSVKDHVDQIVIVDTGSTDDTISIAEKYTEEIYHYEWTNDFAAARNESLKYATSDWILVLDADHQLNIEGSKLIPQPSDHLGWMIPEISDLTNGSTHHLDRLLLFRNIPGLCYEGKIHEHPLRSINSYAHAMKISDPIKPLPGVTVSHCGFDEPEVKLKRNLSILEAVLQDKGPISHYSYKYLLTLRGMGNQHDYLNYLEEIAHDPSWDSTPPTRSGIGILGLMGEAGLSGEGSPFALKYFENRVGEIGETIHWADTRISVPYATLMVKKSKIQEAIYVLRSCIQHGLAPAEIGVSRQELTAPFHILFSLYRSLGMNEAMVEMMGQMPELLDGNFIQTNEVIESIAGFDPTLFEYMYAQMESITQAN